MLMIFIFSLQDLKEWDEKGTENVMPQSTLPYAQRGGGWYNNQHFVRFPVISWNTEANLGYGVTKPKFTKPRQCTSDHTLYSGLVNRTIQVPYPMIHSSMNEKSINNLHAANFKISNLASQIRRNKNFKTVNGLLE